MEVDTDTVVASGTAKGTPKCEASEDDKVSYFSLEIGIFGSFYVYSIL